MLEAILASRLPLVRGLHPAVACALEHFDTPSTVQAVVRETGYSHRHFNALFARSVGLNPKAYVRVQRFRKALERIAVGRSSALAALALDAGYSDQAHFNREFLAFTGLTPGAYRASAPAFASHVALEPASRRSA